ncbi:MAG: hypothetical protein VB913_15930 [Rhodospirillales bacterium]
MVAIADPNWCAGCYSDLDHPPDLEKGDGKIRPLAVILFILLSLPTFASAQKWIEGPVSVELVRVIDGEHIEVRAKFPNASYKKQIIKLLGIDAPELEGACQKERALARKTKHRLIEILGNRLTLSNIMTSDGDAPFLAQVTTISGHDPVHMLTLENLARPNWGGHAFGWCEDLNTCLVKNCDQ